jgi:hypothetical protein
MMDGQFLRITRLMVVRDALKCPGHRDGRSQKFRRVFHCVVSPQIVGPVSSNGSQGQVFAEPSSTRFRENANRRS